jgi:hypothetical protein
MRKPWVTTLISLIFVLVVLGACEETGNVGPVTPSPTPTPCGLRCAPPIRLPANAQTVQLSSFSVVYTSDWGITNQDTSSVILEQRVTVQGQTLGIFDVKVASTSVPNGTSASQLLTSVEQNFDTSQLAGIQDDGPIYGAEIGYTAGAGEIIQATLVQANAPSAPVFLEFMASTRNTTGLVFIAVSTINPAARNPARVLEAINGEFDQLANGVVW